jgi:hypothetical protein
MPAKTKPGRNLSLSQKFSRLCSRLGEPEWRRYGGTLFAHYAAFRRHPELRPRVDFLCEPITCTRPEDFFAARPLLPRLAPLLLIETTRALVRLEVRLRPD